MSDTIMQLSRIRVWISVRVRLIVSCSMLLKPTNFNNAQCACQTGRYLALHRVVDNPAQGQVELQEICEEVDASL